MTASPATPATSDSSTLYFGPWYRRSPFFEKTLEAGCIGTAVLEEIRARDVVSRRPQGHPKQ